MLHSNTSVLYALLAAALFGISTPFAKLLVGEVPPVLLGGMLYLGSGVGLAIIRVVRDRGWSKTGLLRSDWPWLTGAIFFGGVVGPVALMFGLTRTSGSAASLLLNLESVLTAMIAWIAFKEHADRRIVFGMLAIVAGGLVLAWPTQGLSGASDWLGPLAVAAACLCWAIDNNLIRQVSASDALFISGSKELIAGTVNCALAIGLGTSWPAGATIISSMVVGLAGYGVSLVLFAWILVVVWTDGCRSGAASVRAA